MSLNPLAEELNSIINEEHSTVLNKLSTIGQALFFPKGILTQGAEAKEKAYRYNATVGIATEGGIPMHMEVVNKYFHDMAPGEVFPYAPSYGHAGLRKAWADKQREEMPGLGDNATSLPVVVNALTHALSVIGEMFINPGDEVILPDQLWGNYKLTWETQRSAKLVTFPFFDDALSTFNIDAFRNALATRQGKRCTIVLNFPNNPTGYHPSKAEAQAIVSALTEAAASGTQLTVLCDDAYYGMFYDSDSETQPLFAWLAQAHKNLLAIKIDGGTKEAFMWGLRVGFITYGIKGGSQALYTALEKKTAGAVRGSISNVTMSGQNILLKALNDPEFRSQQAAKVSILRKRFDAVRQAVFDEQYADSWQAYPFNAGYFMCLKLKGVAAEAVRVDLLDRHGIGTVALGGGDLRVAFSCLEEADIADCFERIADSVRTVRAS